MVTFKVGCLLSQKTFACVISTANTFLYIYFIQAPELCRFHLYLFYFWKISLL